MNYNRENKKTYLKSSLNRYLSFPANKKIILSDYNSFDIAQTLECGQVFRFTRLDENDYTLIAFSRKLRVTQNGDTTEFSPCTPEEFEQIWIPYFDLDRDYAAIKAVLSSDPIMAKAIEFASGIRILRQDPWEILLSFIISQNMNIPRIKKLIQMISERYGDCCDGFYSFPAAEKILPAGIDGLIDCRVGFRAKYLYDAICKITRGELDLSVMEKLPTPELKSALKSIYGVGDKVADCVSLFAFGRHDVFPMDVWIKRAMQQLYFGGRDINPKAAYEFAIEKFGENAGIAQQYLFHYMRSGGRE